MAISFPSKPCHPHKLVAGLGVEPSSDGYEPSVTPVHLPAILVPDPGIEPGLHSV